MRLPPVYAITDRRRAQVPVQEIVRVFLDSGLRCVQIREKDLSDESLLAAVQICQGEALRRRALLIVNDRTDIARIAGCGVHLGQDDLPPQDARALLGPGAPIGVSTHDPEEARRALASPFCDYVAFGPVFPSPTKPHGPSVGLEMLSSVAMGKGKPLVAIGGIALENLEAVWDAGADSAAMISALNRYPLRESARDIADCARRRFLPRKLWLVGFMGCGKTTIGRLLAQRLHLPLFDLDLEIERASGRTVRSIFEREGETEFRRRERAYVEGSLELEAGVFAAGGGTFIADDNRRMILKSGISVFIDVPFDALAQRAAAKVDRPLFRDVHAARRLFEDRLPFYKMASLQIPFSGAESAEAAAERILGELDERLCVI